MVRLAFGTDERTALTESLVADLQTAGHEVEVVADAVDWPDAGRAVGEAVASGRATLGIVTCTTGTGVAMAANKVPGVRAALCTDADTARGARRWNDANVLAFGLRLTSPAIAREMVEAFLSTPFDPDESSLVAKVEPGVVTGHHRPSERRARRS